MLITNSANLQSRSVASKAFNDNSQRDVLLSIDCEMVMTSSVVAYIQRTSFAWERNQLLRVELILYLLLSIAHIFFGHRHERSVAFASSTSRFVVMLIYRR